MKKTVQLTLSYEIDENATEAHQKAMENMVREEAEEAAESFHDAIEVRQARLPSYALADSVSCKQFMD